MPGKQWSDEELEKALELEFEDQDFASIAVRLNEQFHGGARVRTSDGVRCRLGNLKPEQSETKSNTPLTEQQMFEMWGLDPKQWRVEKIRANNYGPYFQTRCDFVRRPLNEVVGSSWAELLTKNESRAIAKIKRPPKSAEESMYEVCTFDAHIGMRAHDEETGQNYDVGIGVRRYREAFLDLADRGPKAGKMLRPVGQDLFHFDKVIDKTSVTARGTPQDVDTRYYKLFRAVCEMEEQNILDALNMGYSLIKVPIVPGNHDKQTCFYLGEWLSAVFRGEPRVEISNEPKKYRYARHGRVLIGMTHGDLPKARIKDLPSIMEVETHLGRNECPIREWHLGHLHHEVVDSQYGVRTRTMPALTSTDAWHYEQGYLGNLREARALLWHAQSGLRDIVIHSVPFDSPNDSVATII